jgi:ketosteroid isomerase-like protein
MRLLKSRTFVGGLVVVALLGCAAALAVRGIVSATAGPGSAGGRSGAAESLPTVVLPPELDRVLRDFERHWAAGDEAGLAALFTEDALLMPTGFAAERGRAAIRHAYEAVAVPVHLRALAYAADDSVGYVVGAYGFEHSDAEAGKFVFTLRRTPGGAWMISSHIVNISHIQEPGEPSTPAAAPR